jgi:eukaryotic-like serine/threonine-protein kinase
MTVERYRIERVLGAGSMGDVYCGVDIDLKRKVALKILSERHRDNAELRARFVREARAVAAIAHPNVVQVFTTGTFDDRPYLAMELLDGTDLGSSVEDHGPWPPLQAARAVLDAARGLEAAAKAGLIHRDVKPSNLVLLQGGVVKVTDFGLAKPLEAADEPALTALGVVVGTPDYIAPEQARGDAIDERVDIYALGGTLYHLLTGVPPFRTGKPGEDKYLKVVARHLKTPPPDARTRNPRANRALAKLAQRMMAKRPVDRPDYAELIEELGAIVERLQAAEDDATEPMPVLRGHGMGNQVSPTPFVGGSAPVAQEHADEAAPTRVHIPASRTSTADTSVDGPPVASAPATAGWLVAITIVAGLIFLIGLGLLLFGPMP